MIKDLILGNNYSKKELVEILNEETLKTSREGIFNCKNSLSTLFFVTLDKSSKEENLHYNDFFEEDFFHWDSQNKQHITHLEYKKLLTVKQPHICFVELLIKQKT